MKFLIPPDTSGYGAEYGEEVVRTQHEGGAGRYRADILNSAPMVSCSWKLDVEQFNYMMAFYRTVTERGATPFEIDLIIDSAALVERTARFVPGSFSLVGQEGLSYSVKATLEVDPIIPDAEADTAIVTAFNEAHS